MLSHRFLVFDLAGPFQRTESSQKISHNTLFFFQIPFRQPCFQFQVFFSRKRCVHLYAPSVSFLEKFHFTTCYSVQGRHHRPSSLIVFCCLAAQTFQSSKMSFFWLAFLYIIEWHCWDGLWDDRQMPSEGSVSSSLCTMSWLWCVPVRSHIVSSVSQPVTSGLLWCCSRMISVVSRRHAICDDGKLMMPQHACYSTPRSSFFLSCQLLSCRFLPRPLSSFLSGSLLFPPSNSTMNKWINQPEPLAGQHPRKKEWSRRQLPPWLTCRWSVKADHVGYPRKKYSSGRRSGGKLVNTRRHVAVSLGTKFFPTKPRMRAIVMSAEPKL